MGLGDISAKAVQDISLNAVSNVTHVFNADYVKEIPNLVQKDLGTNLLSLGIYVLGIALYAVVIWIFYRHLGKRDIFKIEIKRPKRGFFAFLEKIWEFITHLIKSLIVFPFITFLWFLVLGGFLLFLSKSHDVGQIMLMSISVIAAARVTAYINEDLSKDLSKLVPFALLGVFIVDPAYFSLEATIAKFNAIPSNIHLILQYLIALVLLEFLLRSIYRMYMKMTNKTPQPPVNPSN